MIRWEYQKMGRNFQMIKLLSLSFLLLALNGCPGPDDSRRRNWNVRFPIREAPTASREVCLRSLLSTRYGELRPARIDG